MEDHSVLSEDERKFKPADEIIISYYLNMFINKRKFSPSHFLRDEDARVYNLNPRRLFQTHSPNYLFVKTRTEACGRTDGCELGCWRIIGRDKLIKQEGTGKFLGLKRVLKFCGNTLLREYKRSWVMEEYRLPRKLNSNQDHVICKIKTEETGRVLGFKKILKFCDKERKRSKEEEDQRIWVMEEYRLVGKWKQDQVICKIRLFLQPAVSSLLAKHFSFLSKRIIPLSRKSFLPRWDLCVPDVPEDEIISYYLKMLVDNQNDWPSHFLQSEQVYGVVPWMIVDANQSSAELELGSYFFVNRTESSGRTDGCDGGCWRIIRRDRVIISKRNKQILGFKRMFKFCEKVRQPVYKFWADENFKENEFKMTWIMDEYRLAKKKDQGKAICRIKLLFPTPLDFHIRYY